jgi:hypothetical protein
VKSPASPSLPDAKNDPAAGPSADRSAALRAIAPFDRVRESELALLSRVLAVRSFAPGVNVHRGGEPLTHLLIVAGGEVCDPAGAVLGPILGLGSLLADAPAPPLIADRARGAEIFFVNRPTFFTLVRECPELLRGFLEIGSAGRRV